MKARVQLPRLLASKLYKTGQTRGADDDDIYQNRVRRNSTVLIPHAFWHAASRPPQGEDTFENGFIALISPRAYFLDPNIHALLLAQGLKLGENVLIFYETREDWLAFNPELRGWNPASSRLPPLGGEYVARIAATTALASGGAIKAGFTSTGSKGAGIRVYEYASMLTIVNCRLQLEALFWLCRDAEEVAFAHGMSAADIETRHAENAHKCSELSLIDMSRFVAKRLISQNNKTMCPLCLEELSAEGFFSKEEQAEGRGVLDLTVTKLNLFHIEELRVGQYGHRPYNLGWGHHHCNLVVKDVGIDSTLVWMTNVVDRNASAGYIEPRSTWPS